MSKCELGYCSAPCYSVHKAVHANDGPSASAADPKPALPEPAVVRGQAASAHPLESLSTSPDLGLLFTRHPSLRSRLHDIYAATLEAAPGEAAQEPARSDQSHRGRGRGGRGHYRGGGSHGTPRPWTAERGMRAGAQQVKRAREEGDVGILEFASLVVRLAPSVEGLGPDPVGADAS
ncbi:MAG: hypothetical protein M1832_001347 [Thelocarpon impressellum]|nr:MAG: hypothetical protein M1832_001347 [Thelocarpon impressellum]